VRLWQHTERHRRLGDAPIRRGRAEQRANPLVDAHDERVAGERALEELVPPIVMDRPFGPDIDGLVEMLERGGLRAPTVAPRATASV